MVTPDDDERAVWLGLLSCRSGPSRRQIERDLWRGESPLSQLVQAVGQRAANRLVHSAAKQIVQWSQRGIAVLCQADVEFPQRLKVIPDPPRLLFVRGRIDCLAPPIVAIVGARRATRLGLEIAQGFARRLSAKGYVIASGLALGIDSAAHRGTLDCGRTVAVLGSGVDCVQPISNRGLAAAILDSGGAVISEYLPADRAAAHHFPERNRLISGLSLGVVVVEAGERSGSLITARLAAEQGREVMAVPGAIGHGNAKGCHRLIKQGAALVEDEQDILDALGVTDSVAGEQPDPAAMASDSLSIELAMVLAAIGQIATGVDEICESLQIPVMQVNSLLSQLELEGFVQRVPDGYIRRPFPPS